MTIFYLAENICTKIYEEKKKDYKIEKIFIFIKIFRFHTVTFSKIA
jgi:hypothetical protein